MNAKILVVEDNPLNLELVADLLEANHFEVIQARTGEEGLRLARERAPELVLMDLSLPGLDGLAATRALKSHPETSHLPVVAVTAHAMRGDEKAAAAAGCDGYVSKPIDTRSFPDTIRGYILRARACAAEPTAPLPSITV